MSAQKSSPEAALLATLLLLGACAATSESAGLGPNHENEHEGDSGAGPETSPPADAGADVELDAGRPLACGDAGFCETRLPTSDYGGHLSLRGVWLVDSNNVWSVSVEGVVLHWDGTSWSTSYRTNHELYSVWATPTATWVGGEHGLLLRRGADQQWSQIETGHTAPILAISGTGPDDVWFMSRDGSADHFDGTTLTNHPIDVPDLRVTTVFGRTGAGTFAAGWVPGPPEMPEEHTPIVVELSTSSDAGSSDAGTNPATFNPSLSEMKRFIPVAGVVTESSSADQQILLTGYYDDGWMARSGYCLLGKEVVHGCSDLGNHTVSRASEDWLPLKRPPATAPAPDKLLVPYGIGAVYRWDGTAFLRSSLAMGSSFDPSAIWDMHGNAKDSWIVGDGFALKGATP